jgi:hypothetical protein
MYPPSLDAFHEIHLDRQRRVLATADRRRARRAIPAPAADRTPLVAWLRALRLVRRSGHGGAPDRLWRRHQDAAALRGSGPRIGRGTS